MLIDEIKQKIEHTLWNIEDNDPVKAQEIYTECLSVLKEQDNDSSNINLCSFCYLRIANCLLLTKNIESAELNVELSLKLAKTIDDAISINRANLFKASVLKSSGKCDEALDILQEIENNLNVSESFDAKQIVGWSNIAASTILMEVKHDLKKALSLSDRAIQILEPINNEAGLLRAYQINYVINKHLGNITETERFLAKLNKTSTNKT